MNLGATLIHSYRDKWILTSAVQSAGGGLLDAEPVRLIDLADTESLARTIRQLLTEDQPTVPSPDWNDRRFKVGIRAEAVGLRSWRTFARNARAFNLEVRGGCLLLEEWPREGYSFTAKAAWLKTFPANAYDEVAQHLVSVAACQKP